MRDVVADAGTEVVTNRAGRGFLRVGGAHGVAPLQDGAFCFEDHGEDFAGAHEIGEFGEEGALFVDRVEAAGFFFGQAHRFYSHDLEARAVDARENLSLLTATDGVGFDDCKSALDCHERVPPH